MPPITPHETHTVIDSTKLKSFMTCPRRYFYEYVLGWRAGSANIHLVFGSAWHEAMEYLLINRDTKGYSKHIEGAFDAFNKVYRESYPDPTEDVNNGAKTPIYALEALELYAQQYAGDDFDVVYTEIAGTVPIDAKRVLHFKMDAVINSHLGKQSLEHKTSSMLSQAWMDQWSLSIQIGTYLHALNCLYAEKDVKKGLIINGMVFRKKGCEAVRIPIWKTNDMMQQWLFIVTHIMDMIEWNHAQLEECNDEDVVMGAFPLNTESCFKFNKMCPYHDFCMSYANPLVLGEGAPDGLVNERWDPRVKAEEAKHVFHLEKEEKESAKAS